MVDSERTLASNRDQLGRNCLEEVGSLVAFGDSFEIAGDSGAFVSYRFESSFSPDTRVFASPLDPREPWSKKAYPYSNLADGLQERAKTRLHCFTWATLASCVSRHFKAIATELHAAPAPRALLAGVKEMQHACGALANTLVIQIRKQTGRALRQRSEQILGYARAEPEFFEARLSFSP